MLKVIVIGSPGSGKSTFARKLRDAAKLPLYYLDMLWHKPDRTTVSREEFDARLYEIVRKDQWIIDGNYQRTLEMRLKVCDTVFFLNYPLEVCLAGVKSRIGKVREDMPWVETKLDEAFQRWITGFPNDQVPQIYGLLSRYQTGKDIFIFRSREEADQYFA